MLPAGHTRAIQPARAHRVSLLCVHHITRASQLAASMPLLHIALPQLPMTDPHSMIP